MARRASVRASVEKEIKALNVADVSPGLAAAAVELAAQMDAAEGPTGSAAAARELRAVMATLRKLAPVEQEGDAVHDITRDRETRRAQLRAVPAAGE